jgi:hypothetical protein
MDSLLTFLAESKDTGGSFTLIEGLLKPGNEPAPHIHGREDELFYILEGEMDMYVGNGVIRAFEEYGARFLSPDEVAEQTPLYFLAVNEANSLTSIAE